MTGAVVEREHAADIYLEIRGGDLDALYEHGLFGLYSVLVEPAGVRPLVTRFLGAAGADVADTLRTLLAEALYAFESEGFVAAAARLTEAGPERAAAVLWGEKLDPTRHGLLGEVKAVTYHRLCAQRSPEGAWTATVILDV
jgi:SHS2 domain-containing protein